jgi:hypothetical protein
MKKETNILLAIGLGFFAAIGSFCMWKKCKTKNTKKQNLYLDEHRHFDQSISRNEFHGVEMDATI